MKKMTKWYLLLVLALVLLCVICAWYYMGVRTSRPDNAELVRAEKNLEGRWDSFGCFRYALPENR
ncbi:MAG: hypothetical protein LUH20_04455 [Lachnospiraceae bacterium]|nr:hypothetical protein [Lachnospiraceae bacterium]